MTIAIGTEFDGGAIVCADTKVSASDGATTDASKVFLAITRTRRMYVLADSAEDAYAARMLAGEISNAISLAEKPFRIEEIVKRVMGPWYNGYHYVHPPQIQFLLAFTQQGWERAMLYFCEPPNTVSYGSPIAIGKGSRAVDPALDILTPIGKEKLDAKSALVKLAYLMYLAKRDEGTACGGETYAIVIKADGGYALIDEAEMREAEQLAKKLCQAMEKGLCKITSTVPNDFLTTFPKALNEIGEAYRHLSFKSLEFVEKNKLWKVGTVKDP
jgi:20S proteasome alpha/beta subunit